MAKTINWFKKNLTFSIIITLIVGYSGGTMAYAAMKYDIQDLKIKILTLPERLIRLEEKVDSTNEKLSDVSKGVDFLIKRELSK